MPPGMRSASFASRSATVRLSVSSSRTQGPAMTKSASSRKIRTSVTGLHERRRGLAAEPLHAHGRGDEARKQRMRASRPRLELRVELAPDEPRVLRVLDDLDELAVGAQAAEAQAMLHEQIAIAIGYLVAVPVALADLGNAVDLGRARTARETRWIGAEPHGPAHIGYMLLRFHERNHGVVALGRELRRVAVFQAA